LGAILTELDELDRLRRLIAMLTAEVPAEPTPRLSTFLAWAEQHLTRRETRLSAQAIEDRFAAEQLFGGTRRSYLRCVEVVLGEKCEWRAMADGATVLSVFLVDSCDVPQG
jgi:hypothetical protein